MGISVKGFLETTFIDWPGRLAAVVFLPGCNFRCPFCHNAELVSGTGELPDIALDAVFRRVAELAWIDGIVVSGGEPTIHGGLPLLLEECSSRGLTVKLDTNGSRPEILAGLLENDLVAHVDMDIKAPLDPASYGLLAGTVVEMSEISESVELIASSGIPHRFRTTVVPGMIGREEVRRIAAALPRSSPLHLQPFDPRRTLDPSLKERHPKASPEEMAVLKGIAAA